MLRILDITAPDINNGNGVRVTLWVAGCTNHCKGCHNQWTWDYDQGKPFRDNKDEILGTLASWHERDYVEGLTLSGGDPMCQDEEALLDILSICKWVREKFPEKNIWLYTGLTYESIVENQKFKFWEAKTKKKITAVKNAQKKVLESIDVLVDGPYIEELRDISHCPFRGSTNQRIMKMN